MGGLFMKYEKLSKLFTSGSNGFYSIAIMQRTKFCHDSQTGKEWQEQDFVYFEYYSSENNDEEKEKINKSIEFYTDHDKSAINGQTGYVKYTFRFKIAEIIYFDKAKAYEIIFDADFTQLDDLSKFILENTIFKHEDVSGLKGKFKVDKLLGIAHTRLKNYGFYVTCSRCHGSGNYSYNLRDGTRCFKCAGKKFTMPSKITKKWRDEVIAFDFQNAIKEKKLK